MFLTFNNNPITDFTYFISLITLSIICNNPIVVIINFISSIIILFIIVDDIYKVMHTLKSYIPFILIISIFNPLFVHKGYTILFYLNNNPVTLEAFAYGIINSIKIVTTIIWFKNYSIIISSEKIVYIFGKIVPSMAIIISIVSRLIPVLKYRLNLITVYKKNTGLVPYKLNYIEKIKFGCNSISILITWALESSIQTIYSMNARGFGFKNRTSFSIYKFLKKDFIYIFIVLILSIILITVNISGILQFNFYPFIDSLVISINSIILFVLYTILLFLPVIFNFKRILKWK